jgi:hypothetical protein
MINNKQHLKTNSDIRNINTRNSLDLHYPVSVVSLPEGWTLRWDKGIEQTTCSNKAIVP